MTEDNFDSEATQETAENAAPTFRIVGPPAPLFAALAAASANFGPIVRSKHVKVTPRDSPAYEFDYAPLEALHAATKPALAAEGLAIIDPFCAVPGGYELRTMLVHKSGSYIECIQFIPGETTGWNREGKSYKRALRIQELGSELTFRRRYAYQCVAGVNAEDDDDGNRAEGNAVEPQKRTQPTPPAVPQRKQPPTKPEPPKEQPKAEQPKVEPAREEPPQTEPAPAPVESEVPPAEVNLTPEEREQMAKLRAENEARVAREREAAQSGVAPIEILGGDPEPSRPDDAACDYRSPMGEAIKLGFASKRITTAEAKRDFLLAWAKFDTKGNAPLTYGQARKALAALRRPT